MIDGYNDAKSRHDTQRKESDMVKITSGVLDCVTTGTPIGLIIENEDQKSKYQKLFHSYFLKSFSSRLVDYTNPRINVVSQKKINDKYTIVNSILEATSKRPQVKIDWRIYTKNPEKPLIRDLIVEGLSLARTQKEEFASIIKSNDNNIEALFESLKKFIDE